MAYSKRIWKGRQGTGLNKFSIDGATPVTVVNQPDSLTEAGDALSAGNLNDWEQRIADAFDDADASIANVQAQVDRNAKEIENLKQTTKQDEQTVSYPNDGNYSSIMPDGVPARVADYAEVANIRGKSRGWNQLCDTTFNYYACTNGGVVDGVYTINNITDAMAQFYQISTAVPQGHICLAHLMFKPTKNVQIDISLGGINRATKNCTANVWNECDFLITMASNMSEISLYVNKDGALDSSDTVQVKKFIIRDLSPMFPEGVPATVADCVKAIPDLLKWDAYDAGSLVDTTVTGVEASVPYDGWDNLMENGYIIQGTGQNVGDDSNYKRSTSYVPVTPSTKYRMRYPSYGGVIFYYGSDKSYIGSGSLAGSSYEFVTGNNVYYIRFWFNYWQTYNNDIYVSDFATLMLSSPFTGKSAGDVAEVLNVRTGKKTRPIETVTYDGSDDESWDLYGNSGSVYAFYIVPSKSIPNVVSSNLANITCDRLVRTTRGNIWDAPFCICTESTYFMVSVNTATDVAGFKTWLASNPITINYELATPDPDEQVCDPIPDNYIEVQANGTIRTIQSQSPVIDNCLDVTYDFIPA